MASSTNRISLKPLIDKKGKRVLFAEAGKDFVYFLFHIFSLPMGTVVDLLRKDNALGCLGRPYVKGVVTYSIMDDLSVKSMSTITGITQLNASNVKDLGAVDEMVVYVGMNEGVKLLKTTMQSNTVFTDVFLAPEKAKRR